MTDSTSATKPLTYLCRCCKERFHIKRTNPYCDWCRTECTNEGCVKPPPSDSGRTSLPEED